MRRIWALAYKEFLHVLRDPRSLALAIAMPLGMLLLYGYAIDMDIKRLKVGILDLDRTQQSADFVRRMTASNFIVDAGRLTSREQVETAFRRDQLRAVLVFPKGYADSLAGSPTARVQVLIDGADGTTAAATSNYLNAVVGMISRDIASEQLGSNFVAPIDTRSRVFFNPELVSAHFIVPGLVALIMIMICALLTSIAIVREKETGTLEQILTTPIRPIQVIIGKVIPYIVIASVDTAMILVIGKLAFGVPMEGSWLVLSGYTLLYLLVSLGLGLLISAVTSSQQVAMTLALVVTILPTMMLSGFVFPVASMPIVLRGISHIIPASYYLIIIRGVMLKGNAWFPFEAGVLLGIAVLLLAMAAKQFRARLD